ncbi:hypothetical protein NIES970_20850 [[Synechococcus] sp. NIES-970]|uniref:hypothetical protein n=1 Tax=Picosynechococcus sp. NKBG15041c TaxID=1407650 RepID=UPI0004037226|nr:hypothetical protein [Picosynechococcus sp. NKBG15041c]BAW97139.1 hypothetical protein NIES970_20850 [[Synechococcus] sp. NIES-970]
MNSTIFFRQHSLKLAIGFAVFGFLCWLYCLSPLTVDFNSLQKIMIYLGLEILYDLLRHWCLKLVRSAGDRLRRTSPFVNDCFTLVSTFQAHCQQIDFRLIPLSLVVKNIHASRVFS